MPNTTKTPSHTLGVSHEVLEDMRRTTYPDGTTIDSPTSTTPHPRHQAPYPHTDSPLLDDTAQLKNAADYPNHAPPAARSLQESTQMINDYLLATSLANETDMSDEVHPVENWTEVPPRQPRVSNFSSGRVPGGQRGGEVVDSLRQR